MSPQDEWGSDPSVRSMRRVFSKMEAIQEDLLQRSNLSRLDGSLRSLREEARNLFERAWDRASRASSRMEEEELARLYGHCFLRVMRTKGIEVRNGAFEEDQKLMKWVDEGFR
jgi:hypothetical protein